MPNLQDAVWFKSQFQPAIEAAIVGTPFSVDMITAIACQETGEIWPALRRKGLPTSRILELCVGDTIDASATGGRRAFPKNKAELVQSSQGQRMFEIARQGLADMAEHIAAYRSVAARPDKFCRGFGIFQLDLQFFRNEPDYFLERRYADFDVAVRRCVGELKAALRRIRWEGKASLTDTEMAGVAIAYNTGRFDPAKGLKQGYFDGKKHYGENFFAYLQLAKSARVPVEAPLVLTPTRSSTVAKKARASTEKKTERATGATKAKPATAAKKPKRATPVKKPKRATPAKKAKRATPVKKARPAALAKKTAAARGRSPSLRSRPLAASRSKATRKGSGA